jgi:hypothetical protein
VQNPSYACSERITTTCFAVARATIVSLMMHLTYGEKSLVLGDDVAEQVVEYAAALARAHTADTLRLNAYGADGSNVQAVLLLDEGAPLMIETTNSDLLEPDNNVAAAYMRDRLAVLDAPPNVAKPLAFVDDDVLSDFEERYIAE